LVDSLTTAQLGITKKIMKMRAGKFDSRLSAWEAEHVDSAKTADQLLQELREGHDLNLGSLVMMEQKLKQLASRA